jgi:hypothetical protein
MPKSKYHYEGNPYITYEEAAEVLGIDSKSVTGFATQNNVKRGEITLRGRKRGVLNTEQFYSVLREKNYFGDQDQVVNWF